MRPYPADTIPEAALCNLRLLASDIDDTLTVGGKFGGEIIELLGRLRAGGMLVWLVTGRCAAWGQALATYFNFDGVITENGGVLCQGEEIRVLADLEKIGLDREKYRAVFQKIRSRIPKAEVTADNIGRVTDWAFYRRPLSNADVALAQDIAAEDGIRIVSSSIHVHLIAGDQTKASALARVCQEAGIVDPETVVTLGDSTNDESLFNPQLFPFSAGVANIADYLDQLSHKPLFLLPLSRAEGAAWLFKRILVCKGR